MERVKHEAHTCAHTLYVRRRVRGSVLVCVDGWAARRVMGHSQAQVRTAVRGRWPATLSSGSTQSQDYLYSMSSLLVVVATGGVTLGWIIGVLLAQLISCSQTDMGIDSA
jgi:hypothetical protein